MLLVLRAPQHLFVARTKRPLSFGKGGKEEEEEEKG